MERVGGARAGSSRPDIGGPRPVPGRYAVMGTEKSCPPLVPPGAAHAGDRRDRSRPSDRFFRTRRLSASTEIEKPKAK